ncbi:TolC family protein [Leptospira andrefontaineae]|uniref:TolC family protein n=1 Tax=Leptospira andrefontaineae TaxID=2484976 RepID=UPI001FCA3305|nr:TolC family protein [Leptospira andrefontaineae]
MKNKKFLNTTILTLAFFITAIPLWARSDSVFEIDLNRAILLGLERNITLQSIERQNEIYSRVIREKIREYFPKFGISYFGLRNLNQSQSDSLYNDVRLTVQQLLYDGGENNKNIEIAKLSSTLNKEEFRIQLGKAKVEIVRKYLSSIAAYGKFVAARRLYLSFESQKKAIESELRNGLRSKLELTEIESKLAQAHLEVTKSESSYNRSLRELKLQLQLDGDEEVAIRENIFFDYVFSDPMPLLQKDDGNFEDNRPDLKKTRIIVERLKKEKEIAEDYWKPKFLVGGYVGKNSNDTQPVRHENYGMNFSVVLPLGSSTFQTQSNYGVQTDGTGIQRIPGYGPQFVGQGENTFNSANFQFMDNLAQSRKILEGEIKYVDAVAAQKLARLQASHEITDSKERIIENYREITAINRKVELHLENYRASKVKLSEGLVKRGEVLKIQYELSLAQGELAEGYAKYIQSCYEYFNASGREWQELPFYKVNQGRGNSIITKLLYENPKNADLFPTPNGKE